MRDFLQRETNDGVDDGPTCDTDEEESEESEESKEEDEPSAISSDGEQAPPRISGRGLGRGRGAAQRPAQV